MKKNIITNNWRNEVKEDFANAIVEAKLDEKLRDKLLLSVKNLMRVGNISLTDTDLHNLINTLQSQIDVLKEEQETQAESMQRNRASGVVFSVATETTAGMVKIATDDDLVNGVNAVSMVTPKNLKTYLAKTGGGGTGVAVLDATETTKGISEIATQAEVNAGTDDNKIVTPKKIKPLIDDLKNDTTALENSTKAKAAELGRVDDGLRKDVDVNTAAIVKLKQSGGTTTTTNVSLATETTAGKAEIATQQEATDGTDDSRIVTPKKLKTITRDLDSRATRIRNDVDRNTADLVTHRTDIQQNTTDIVSNTASIATIISTLKKGITTTADKLAQSFTVPAVLHDKVEVKGEDTAGHYGYALAMHNDYLAVSDPVLQEVVIYHRDKNNKKIFNIEDVHKGKKHGGFFEEDGQIYVKRKDGKFLDIFEYDENQTNLTFRKVNTINLSLSYGNSLAINDDYLIVGNPHSKTALIYKHSGIKWQLVKQLNGGDSFGSSVAITDKNIIIAEPDNKKIEVFDLAFNKVKTITGGASYSKLVDGNNYLTTVAEPDNNILKIYENLAEIASKTVKADCVSVGTGIVLATSKTDKKAYIYDFYSKTGWFTTTRTKWSGLPDNTQGYTGYNIAGGQYQLVRPVGTTDTYTKYKGGWVKNGTWGGVLWYLGGKIGFERGDDQWHQLGVDIPVEKEAIRRTVIFDDSGYTVAVGCQDVNYAEVYEFKNGAWVLKGKRLTGSGKFGRSVSMSSDGNTVVVGCGGANYAEVYEFKSGAWVLKGKRLTGSGDFGRTVSMSNDGNIVAIGNEDTYTEVYEFKSGAWVLKGKRLTGSGDFGTTVALSSDGNTVIVGAYDGSYAEVYEFKNSAWVLKGKRLTGSGGFGVASQMSSDGNTVIVGTYTGSYAEVYEFKNGAWVLKGKRLTGSGKFGRAVSMSSDGNTVAAASSDDTYAEVYEFKSGAWALKGSRLNTVTGACLDFNKDASILGVKRDYTLVVYIFKEGKYLYLDTTDGKHYYDKKELKDETNFDRLMETVAPLASTPDLIVQANRNLKLTNTDIQEQPNKTGNYVSLLGTGTATTPVDITKLDTNFTIDANYGDACAITKDKILITNKTDSKLAIYDHKGTKEKEIQLEAGVGSVIDATDTEAVVGSETANTVDIVSLT